MLDSLKSLIPQNIKRVIRDQHRRYILDRSLRKAQLHIEKHQPVPENLLDQMIYGWGNEGWSAKPILLNALLAENYASSSSILECGTGLSTLLFAMLARQTGAKHTALEHDVIWHRLVCHEMSSLGLPTDRVRLASLKNYGEFEWYDVASLGDDQSQFDFVFCDGPPNDTRGGRYGLLPTIGRLLRHRTRIMVDDIVRADELQMIARWIAECGGNLKMTDRTQTYAILTLSKAYAVPAAPPSVTLKQ